MSYSDPNLYITRSEFNAAINKITQQLDKIYYNNTKDTSIDLVKIYRDLDKYIEAKVNAIQLEKEKEEELSVLQIQDMITKYIDDVDKDSLSIDSLQNLLN